MREEGKAACPPRTAKTSRTCQPPNFTPNGSSTRKSHKKDTCRFHVKTDLSNSSIFLDALAATCPPGDTLNKMKKGEEDIPLEEESGEYFGATVETENIAITK